MDTNIYYNLIEMQKTHWWYVHRKNILLDFISKLELKNKKILIIGCGMGADFNIIDYNQNKVYAIDTSSIAIEYCKKIYNNIKYENISIEHYKETEFDFIFLLDVLEHIKDENKIFDILYKCLKNKGKMLLTVPAYKCLWSSHDELSHHIRRYSKQDLSEKVINAKFTIEYIGFFYALPFPFIYLFRKIKNLFLKSSYYDMHILNNNICHAIMNKFMLIEKYILKRKVLPFGSSLLCLAKK